MLQKCKKVLVVSLQVGVEFLKRQVSILIVKDIA
jgi:hypothetical protein